MKNMGEPVRKNDENYTYADYRNWPDDERWEIIDGVAFNMSPAPSSGHQAISFYLSTEMGIYLRGKPCRAFAAPFDVYFPGFADQDMDEISTIVQPDLTVICDPSKIIDKGCLGAPDLVMEILSPSTSARDMNIKFSLYERSGVNEYWIVDSGNEYIRIFHLSEKGKYDDGSLFSMYELRDGDTTVRSDYLDGFTVDLKALFSQI